MNLANIMAAKYDSSSLPVCRILSAKIFNYAFNRRQIAQEQCIYSLFFYHNGSQLN
jgi:hypothetical protein